MTWWPDGRRQLRAGISSGFPEKWRRWPEIAAVAQSWLDRKETLPEATAFSGDGAITSAETSRVLEKSYLPDRGGGCAAAANETGATMSIPSQRAGNDRSKQDPAAAAVPSEFARRGDLKGLSEVGRPSLPARPFRCRTVRPATRGAAVRNNKTLIIGMLDPAFGGLAQFL
jgi:hypothetical protein